MDRRQEMFCREYVIDFNGTRAAIAAGYSRGNAANRACELLQVTDIAVFIGELLEGKHERARMSAEDIQNELEKIAKADRRNLFDENGNIKPLNEIDDATAAILEGVEITDKGGIKIKTVSKLGALQTLAQGHGKFAQIIRHTGQVSTVNAVVNLDTNDPVEASRLYQKLMSGE